MHSPLTPLIRARTPMTVAAFMDLALYDPNHGYYATRPQRSGAAGDFFTSIDVGPLFGETIAVQLAEMRTHLRSRGLGPCDLVEVGAGNGRLTRDILDATARDWPACYDDLRVTLVERSAAARAAAAGTLGCHADKLVEIRADLPATIRGVVVANELFDAFPVHVLSMTADGLREVYVTERNDMLAEAIGPVSDPRLGAALAGKPLPEGWRGEVSLEIPAWIGRLSSALDLGFLLAFDYVRHGGGDTAPLEGVAGATLTSHARHTSGMTSWLHAPGSQDITAHVDLAAVRSAATEAGFEELGCVDQTYFLKALGLLDRLPSGSSIDDVRRRLAARTLMLPGGLGSTIKAMAFGKGMQGAGLRGFASGRLT